MVTKRLPLAELFVFACNPVHHGVNAIQPRVPLSAFFVSRLSLQGLPHSRRLPRVSVPNLSLPRCERDGPIGSKNGPKSLDLSDDARQKLTTRSRTRPASDSLRRRDFSDFTTEESPQEALRKTSTSLGRGSKGTRKCRSRMFASLTSPFPGIHWVCSG